MLRVMAAALALTLAQPAASPPAGGGPHPPPVDDASLAARLFAMTDPAPGERAVIVFDPTYYPEITNRLRELLHQRGVETSAIVEDTPEMIASYLDDDAAHNRREREIVETWRPLFERSDIFYWMPTRGYGDDLRWETLTNISRVRSVHFHWLLRFPGSRTEEEIVAASRANEERALRVDLAEHARSQLRLAAAMRGQTIRITTPAGTDLTMALRPDEWIHFGDGNASRGGTAAARWLRDRMIELPVGMFQFVPDPHSVSGTLVAPAIAQAGDAVRDVRLRIGHGRIAEVAASAGADWITRQARDIGPDGDRIGLVSLNTNPLVPPAGIGIDIGANWENGATNRATRMWRMSLRLTDATITAGGKPVMRDGRILWDRF